MGRVKDIIKLLRIRQWVKNGFVFAGLVFSGLLASPEAWKMTIAAFGAFCAASSAVYVLNDSLDRRKDALHPVKKDRPIASGRVKLPLAALLTAVLLAVALALPLLVGSMSLLYCIAGYFVLMLAYSLYLKRIVIIDVMVIAAGFLIRAVAGVVVLDVSISEWLILCTALLALFLALNKRRGEIEKFGSDGSTRGVLRKYSLNSLADMLNIITPSIVVCYALYTFNSPAGARMMLTLPFVIYGLFRYIYIADRKAFHDAPEEALLKDIPLLVCVALWAICSALIMTLY